MPAAAAAAPPSASVVALQVLGVLALHVVWFGALLPGLWVDKGFPAILEACHVRALRLDAFDAIAAHSPSESYLPFALAASLLHTAVVVGGVLAAGRIARTRLPGGAAVDGNPLPRLLAGLAGAAACLVALHAGAAALFGHSFTARWGFGFEWARFFFESTEEGARNFGRVTAASLTLECAVALVLRLSTPYRGVYPRFASKAVPRSLAAFVANYALFRYVLTERVVRSLAAASGLFNGAGALGGAGGEALANLNLTEWAALAAAVHTLSLALGMTFYYVVRDLLSCMACSERCRAHLRQSAVGALRFAVLVAGAFAFFHTLQMWLAYAGEHGVEFVARSTAGFFEERAGASVPSSAAVAVAGGSYTLFFLLGACIAEGPPARCAARCTDQAAACTSRNLRLRKAPPFRGVRGGAAESTGAFEPLLLAGTAVCLALYVADHHLLGRLVVGKLHEAQELGAAALAAGPALWKHLFATYSKGQLFWLTLPVLLVSEIPLWFFTALDYLKLRSADTYRIHYSKVEKKRPRLYPTKAELWKAFKIHCINFFGLYCSVFVVGVGFACKLNIFPYSFSEELPRYWLAEFLACSFFADVLFYVFHRAVHSKGLYQRLHKMHHEWIYTIALAHHYMDHTEALIFMLPPIIPPMLMGSHITIVWAMVLLTQLGGILGHSAFMIPIISSKYTKWIPFINSEYHDLHHLRFNVNYGAVWPVVDMIFGTYRQEPIIYIDGVEPELAAATPEGKGKEGDTVVKSATKQNAATEEEEAQAADDLEVVAESAEAASSGGGLPEPPWYISWLMPGKKTKTVKVA